MVLLIFIATAALLIIIYDQTFDKLKLIAIFLAPLSLFIIIINVLYFQIGPTFTMAAEGFLLPSFAKERIPWTEILHASKMYFPGPRRPVPLYKVEITSSFARTLTRQGPWRLVPTGWQRRSTVLYLPLVQVSDDPDRVFGEFARRIADAKRSP